MPETSGTQGNNRVITPLRVVAGTCLFAPFIAMLWVSSYAKVEPTLMGMPFFYWYQMMWVPISAVLTVVALALVRRDQRARKEGAGE